MELVFIWLLIGVVAEILYLYVSRRILTFIDGLDVNYLNQADSLHPGLLNTIEEIRVLVQVSDYGDMRYKFIIYSYSMIFMPVTLFSLVYGMIFMYKFRIRLI